jgi:hypothetical protein
MVVCGRHRGAGQTRLCEGNCPAPMQVLVLSMQHKYHQSSNPARYSQSHHTPLFKIRSISLHPNMRVSSSILAVAGFTPVVLSAATCPATPCKPGIYSQVANALKGFVPAQQYCTSKYPVPRQTCTSVALPATITTTVATNTVQTTVATTTLT